MTIETIRDQVNDLKGKMVRVTVSGSRNKTESYDGVIKEIYPYIFVLEVLNHDIKEKKSFSYTDILTNSLEIKHRNIK